MAEKKRQSIIPDMPGTEKIHAPEPKRAPVTDIDSLIEPPSKNVMDGINAASIEKAVKSANIPMILMIFVLLVFGLIILYSVSGPDAYGQFQDSTWFLNRQIRFTIAGLVVMFIVAFIPIDFFRQKWICYSAYILSFGLAVATHILGVGREHGASRWINIGPIQLQGSEIIKVALIVAFAGYRSTIARLRSEGRIKSPKTRLSKALVNAGVDFIIPVTMCIVVDIIILLQPHLSCFIIVALVVFMCALVSEISAKSWFTGLTILAVVGVILGVFVLAFNNEDEGLTRDDTRQVDNAHNALGSGGMWGVGLGNSRSKYNYVSEAQNDYIFSIYVEETGFVGGVLLILMYMVMFIMCVIVCWRAKDVFSRTIATGCTALIFVEVLMNISVELQVIPATGVTLPFVSYGGTAQVTLLIAYGLILSVSRSGTLSLERKKRQAEKRMLNRGA